MVPTFEELLPYDAFLPVRAPAPDEARIGQPIA
jgi:hypothetical protein